MNVSVTVDFQFNDYKVQRQLKQVTARTSIHIPAWPPRLDSLLLRVGNKKTVVQVTRISYNDVNQEFGVGASTSEGIEVESELRSDPNWEVLDEA